jgi:ABC-2 type transport system ATP-binding protein
LDEPTDGLDPNQKHHVRTLLADMAKDKAIIISTHILEEVDALCTRAIVIAKGKIVADAKPAELEARSSYHHAVTLRLPASQVGPATGVLETVEGVIRVEASDLGGGVGQLLAFPRAEADILDPVCRAVERAGLAVNEVYVERGRLDEVFRQLTQAAA